MNVERTVRGCNAVVAKIKNAAADWFWDETVRRVTIVNDGVESMVVLTSRNRKPSPLYKTR